MGWWMVFWVVVIVAVPTVLWFLMPMPPARSRKTDESSNITSFTPLFRSEGGREEECKRVGISEGRKGGGRRRISA